ncbi:hypothetical protein SDC9_81266 [bioreactor metagenome]|uniref:VTC domain-containing protein n=1 Tax=bioreactor metagenome TaxID=1076179 RepID=A0A644Z294_9ZZZZ
MMGQNVFCRYEKKYMLTRREHDALMIRLAEHIKADVYGKSSVCSMYFDTPDYRLVRASLEHPVYKEKLRVRSYGIPGEDDQVFVELKKKYKGVVYKRRVSMTLAEATNYLLKGIADPEGDCQIRRELDWTMKHYQNLAPAMMISYDREAFYDKENPNLRITFDTNLRCRTDRLDLGYGPGGTTLLAAGEHLMEVKVSGAMPLWLTKALNELRKISYTKYGTGYRQLILQESSVKGVLYCA